MDGLVEVNTVSFSSDSWEVKTAIEESHVNAMLCCLKRGITLVRSTLCLQTALSIRRAEVSIEAKRHP